MAGSDPFFLIGVERSGTGLLRLMLGAHPRLAVPPAGGFLLPLRGGIDDPAEPTERERFVEGFLASEAGERWGLDAEALRREIAERDPQSYPELGAIPYLAWRRRHAPGATRWGDAHPHHARFVRALLHLYPSARIVHVLRDGRDVAASWRSRPPGPQQIEDAARLWASTLNAVDGCAREFPERVFQIRFETLVRQPERTLRAVCAFLDEPYEPTLLDFTERAPGLLPPDAAHIGTFRRVLRVAEVRAFETLAGAELSANGYVLTAFSTVPARGAGRAPATRRAARGD